MANPEGGYLVRSVYAVLLAPLVADVDPTYRFLWVHSALSNVYAFMWKLVRDRLPTRVNLAR